MFTAGLSLTLLLTPLLAHAATVDESKSKSQSAYRFDEVLSLLSSLHISGATSDELLEAAMQGMIDSLDDPYTVYMEPAQSNSFQNAVNGQGVGLGFQLGTNDKGIYVNRIFPGTPAEQSGLRTGDYILAVEGQPASTLTPIVLNKALSGKKAGDKITLTILRGEDKQQLTFTFANIQYPILSQNVFNGNVGYIALYSFSWNAELEFAKALDDLQARGMKSLIIDLRNNGGGYVAAAQKLAGHFLENGIFMYEKKQGVSEPHPVEITDGHRLGLPITVLINDHSASASEMFAGFMQDHKLATIIGTSSYGKGVAQQVIPLISGGSLKVTDTEWLTPAKHEVNHIGIQPDIEVSGEIEPILRGLLALQTHHVDLELSETTTRLNQVELPVNIPYKQVGGSYYIPARVLAALGDEDIQWDARKSIVTLKTKTSETSFPVTSEVTGAAFLADGTSWIQLSSFGQQLPGLTWTASPNGLTLHVTIE